MFGEPPVFMWSIGEEGSDPIVTSPSGPLRQDQYRQSGHYDRMRDDLRTIADCGVNVVRYGMPWRLTEPEPGRYDWTLWDRALGEVDAAGLTPVVDLLHFGLPDHAAGFLDPSWIESFCRYADAFLARYTEPTWFTPVNEPGITALLTARFGLWNDQRTSCDDHAKVLANVVLANLEVIARVSADRNGWWLGSEGFDVWIDPDNILNTDDRGGAETDRRRAMSWLVWDLHFGRDPLPGAASYLDGVDERIRRRIADLATTHQTIAGHDFYPTSIRTTRGEPLDWSIDDRVGFGIAELRVWHARYGVPFWISETSNLSLPVSEQQHWLTALSAGLGRLLDDDVPVRGLCWYSRGDQFDWGTALANPTGAVTEVGLFDVHRNRRAVADTRSVGGPGARV